ncbi:hypothetical protein SLEP1_g33421 [Rubroshorea leprosula]|uniref:TF-B3 domain-containing protein n=1 Tax=Rubroshorea leprosula TaxID=152421 RepID=A0AAV5KGQ6_9ROSI|nr:hypothetical protein SLEP1_g33421 [Rubroshorea leprosula]
MVEIFRTYVEKSDPDRDDKILKLSGDNKEQLPTDDHQFDVRDIKDNTWRCSRRKRHGGQYYLHVDGWSRFVSTLGIKRRSTIVLRKNGDYEFEVQNN